MTGRIVKSLGLFGLVSAWAPFLACNLLQIGGSTDNTNDNTTGNTNDNATDNTNDNTTGNANDNGSTANLAVFVDPDSDFATSDVRDVDEEIVRFDNSAKTIIWAADGTAFDAGSWEVDGLFLDAGHVFQARFGTKDGQRRAYFIETATETICQIEPVSAALSISRTDVTVPQE